VEGDYRHLQFPQTPIDAAVQFRNQRYGQGLRGAQGLDDELLRVVADLPKEAKLIS